MPSKRTSDSVDRILEEVNRRQTADAMRSGVNDQQVNEILKSLGLGDDPVSQATVQLGPIPTAELPQVELEPVPDAKLDEIAFGGEQLDEILPELDALAKRPAPAPAPEVRRRPTPRPQPKPAPQKREPEPALQPPVKSAKKAEPAPAPIHDPDFSGSDITQSGEIKNFLDRAIKENGVDNSSDLTARKEQFKKFFGKSVAVVPEEMGGGEQEPGKKKKFGIFGGAEKTVSGDSSIFVPINVSLGTAAKEQPAPETVPGPEPEPLLSERQAQEEKQVYAGGHGKKRRFGLFGGRKKKQEEDLIIIPEPREETEPELAPAPLHAPAEPPAPVPAPAQEKNVKYQSKYAGVRQVHSAEPENTFASLDLMQAINRAKQEREKAAAEQAALETAQKLAQNARPTAPEPEQPLDDPDGYSRGEAPAAPAPEPASTATGEIALGARQEAGESTDSFLKRFVSGAPMEEQKPKKKKDTVEFLPGQKPAPKSASEMPVQSRAAGPVGEPVMTPTDMVEQPAPPQDPPLEHSAGFSVRMDVPETETPLPTGEVPLAPISPEEAPQESLPGFDAPLSGSAFVDNIAQSINAQPTMDALDTAQTNPSKYAEAAQTLTEDPTGEFSAEKTGEKKPFRLGGVPDDEEESEAPAPPFKADTPHGAPLHEYEKTEDAPAIQRMLDKAVLTATTTVIVCAAVSAVLLYLGAAAMSSVLPLPAMLDPLNEPLVVHGVMLVLLLLCCAMSWRSLLSGLKGIAGKATADTIPALAAVAAAAQLVVFMAQPGWYSPKDHCLMAGLAALVLAFDQLGHMLDARTTRAGFALVSSKVEHSAAYRLKESGVVHAVTEGLGESKPWVFVSRPTQLFKGFLRGSAAPRTSDKNQQQLAWALGACALLGLALGLILHSDQPGRAVTSMAAVLCMGAPLAGTLISALPAQLMQRSAARVGAVVPGWKDIRQLGRANVVQVTAKDLFPSGCVRLGGIKMARQQDIDAAITDVASILVEGSPTLRDVFLNMIGGNRKLLKKVDDLKQITGMGYVGWIDGNRVLVGNRRLMLEYGVRVPSEEFEQRYAASRHRIVYLAVSGNLYAVFLMSYVRDNDTAAVLESLHQRGISLVVTSDDFNCDSGLIESVYSLPQGGVKVLNADETDALAPAVAWLPESEGCMLHLGSFASFVGGLEAAAGAAEAEHRASLVVAASVLISCLMGVVLSFTGGVASLALPIMVLYQAGWCALALLFPLLQRY